MSMSFTKALSHHITPLLRWSLSLSSESACWYLDGRKSLQFLPPKPSTTPPIGVILVCSGTLHGSHVSSAETPSNSLLGTTSGLHHIQSISPDTEVPVLTPLVPAPPTAIGSGGSTTCPGKGSLAARRSFSGEKTGRIFIESGSTRYSDPTGCGGSIQRGNTSK